MYLGIPGGDGKCNLLVANISPGASNATAGNPNVLPNNEANAPPNECPVTQISVVSGG